MGSVLARTAGAAAGGTDDSATIVGEQRYLPFGRVREDAGTISQTDLGYTSQRNISYIKLLDYRSRWYDSALGRFIAPDAIVPNPSNPQTFNRFSYVLNNPIRYNDPSGHAVCPYSECDVVVHPQTGSMQLRGNLFSAAGNIARDLGTRNDLEAMTSIVEAGTSAFRSYDRLLPQLSNVFLGVSTYGPGTLLAALGNGCAGVGRDPTSCPSNQIYFSDRGFHPDFRDGNNQLFHLWAYIAETSAPGNAAWGAFGNQTARIGNYVHEVVQSQLGFDRGDGTSWNDYVLSEAGMEIGALITNEAIRPEELAATIVNTVGRLGSGSGGTLEALLERNGPLGDQ